MKKILLALLLTGSFGLMGPGAFWPKAYAEVTTVAQMQAQEQAVISALREKIAAIKITEEHDLADFILKKITGEIGTGVDNPTKRAEYFDKLTRILAIKDDAERLTALKNFGKDPDKDGTTDTGTTDTKTDEKALAEKQSQCTSSGGSWSYASKSCTAASSGGLVSGTGQGTGSTGSGSTGSGSSGGGSSGGGSGGGIGSGFGGDTGSGSGSSGTETKAPPPKILDDGSGTECGFEGAKVTAYGYTGDHTPDSNSNYRCKSSRCASACDPGGACGIGNRNNLLVEGRSFAVSKDIVNACSLKVGDTICVDLSDEGRQCGTYEDTSPQKNNVDRYMPNVTAKFGNNYFKRAKGRILKLTKTSPIIRHPGK